MAIYKGVSGTRVGSVGGETYAISKGDNIVKAKITHMSNPRSYAQMQQRATFAQAIRFYQEATRNFFKFAFSSKRQNESDYNAFMRLNAKTAPIVPPYDADKNPAYPLVGEFQMTQGGLYFAPTVSFGGKEGAFYCNCNIHLDGDYQTIVAPTTVAEASAILVEHFGLKYGQIVTVPCWNALGKFFTGQIMLDGAQSNAFRFGQFILSSTDSTPLTDLVGIKIICVGTATALQFNFRVEFASPQIQLGELVAGGCGILSEPTPYGLEVSNSTLTMSAAAQNLLNLLNQPAIREQLLKEWGATPGAILAGSK